MTGKRYGLSPKHAGKKAREFVDYDYLDKLSPEEREWLDRFSREYYHNNFAAEPNAHPPTDKLKLYAADHARRRDIWNNLSRADHDLESMDRLPPTPKAKKKENGKK